MAKSARNERGVIYQDLPTDDVEFSHGFHLASYCTNEDCCIRDVTILAKWESGEAPPKRVDCPVCHKPLKFHHHLRTEAIKPHDPEPDPQFPDERDIDIGFARDMLLTCSRTLREDDGGFLPPRDAAADCLDALYRQLEPLQREHGARCKLHQLTRR